MKNLILASAAALVMNAGVSFAAMPLISLSDVVTGTTGSGNVHLARKGSDDGGGDDRGGDRASGDDRDDDGGKGRGRGRGGDDRGGGDSASNDDSADDSSVSGSGRSKPRVPDGSGCDSADDVAEHAACSPSQ